MSRLSPTPRKHDFKSPLILANMVTLALIALLCCAPRTLATICIVPDAGGTAQMPPNCTTGYLSPQQVHMIINGLPPGTTILIDAAHRDFFNIVGGPGGQFPGGEFEQFSSFLQMQLQGTGMLNGYSRNLSMLLQCETHIGPRTLGAPVQTFPNDMFRMQGQLPPGDPDFDLLRITAGTFFGMPSPGHTTLTRQSNGNWAVDSFFDVFYQVDFIGAPGGPFGGMSGSTTGTIRMALGQEDPPIFCRCKGDSNLDALIAVDDAPWFVAQLLADNGDLCADINNDLIVNGRDIQPFVNLVLGPQGCPALDAWETPDPDPSGDPLLSSFYQFGDGGDQPVIPANFFDPGSLPFNGIVILSPQPIDNSQFGPTDTIVKRPGLPPIPFPGPPVVVPIEMVALNLVSAQPISVVNTSPPGTSQWLVNVAISDTPAPGGMMSVQATGPNGGVFNAMIRVNPVFVFTNQQDLFDMENGVITPDQVRVRILNPGDPGSPLNPLQLQFGDGPTQSPWVAQACLPSCPNCQPAMDGLFTFHNPGSPFIPGVDGPFNPCDTFKPGPMKHVTPGESHYVKPPNKNPPGPTGRCYYTHFGSKAFCQPGKLGNCPPAPAILCGRKCPPLPCQPWAIRLVKIACKGPVPPPNPGWCVQFYRLRPPPLDCTICP